MIVPITEKNIRYKMEETLRSAAEGVDSIRDYVWRMSQDVYDMLPVKPVDEKISNIPVEIVEGEQVLLCEPR